MREHLAYLGLTAAAQHLSTALDRAQAEQLSVTHVLEALLEIEVRETKARRQRGRLRFARYPVYKTLAQFDFDFQPALDRQVVAELSTLRFIEERRNVLLLGPPGVGKTHLSIALGWRLPKPATAPTSLPRPTWSRVSRPPTMKDRTVQAADVPESVGVDD